MDSTQRPRRWTVGRLPPLFSSRRSRTITLAVLLVAVVVLAAGVIVVREYLPLLSDPAALRETIAGYGPAAPLVFVCLQALQVLIAPIPGQVLGLASGYLFGAAAGTVYSLLGATIGSAVAFTLARRLGRPFVEAVIHVEVLETFDELVDRDGTVAMFLIFLIPGLPDDAVCLLGGLTRISIPRLVALSIVGRLPGYLLLNLAGAGAAEGDVWLVVGVGAIVAGTAALAVWKRTAILAWAQRV